MTHVIKRVMDFVAALAGLVVLAPLLAMVAVMIRSNMGSPVLFEQQRPGLHGRLFTLLKFRTMTDACDADGRPLPDAERLTRLGTLLRKTSIDELPSLWNVLKGEMSLVGPRPLLTMYLPYLTERECLRLSMKPGITGWAQIHGRNQASWDQRFENDVWFVEHWTLWLDFKILLLTLERVFTSKWVVVDARSIMLNLDEERAGLTPGPASKGNLSDEK